MPDSPSSSEPDAPDLKGRLVVALIKALGLLPLTVARGFGGFVGYLCWLVQEKSAKVTLANIRLCYPGLSASEQKKLAFNSVIETGKLAAEICVIRQRDYPWLRAKVQRIHGEKIIKEEIAKGKGVILLAPHLGNWEVLSQSLPTYGKLTALYQPPKQQYLEQLIKDAREKTGATLVPTNRKGIVKLLASLRQGGITAVLPDQNPADGSGVYVPFFGEQAYTMTMVHGFLARTECAVIMGFVKRVRGGFETYYLPAPEGIYSEDQAVSVAALNEGVEQCVAHCPDQYQWEYKRFKNNPDTNEQRYQF